MTEFREAMAPMSLDEFWFHYERTLLAKAHGELYRVPVETYQLIVAAEDFFKAVGEIEWDDNKKAYRRASGRCDS